MLLESKDINNKSEFIEYKRNVRKSLLNANRVEVLIDYDRLCSNIAKLYSDMDKLNHKLSLRPGSAILEEKIEEKQNRINEAITFLNNAFVIDLMIG